MKQPEDWKFTWMTMAADFSKRSKDPSFQAGAVLVDTDNKGFLGMGFNGPAPYSSDNFDWEDRKRKHLVVQHAESNCLWNAALTHTKEDLWCSKLYVNGKPCHKCALEAIRAGVVEIYYDDLGPQPKMVDEEEWEKVLFVTKDAEIELIPYSDVI
jgi:deoxycytidylate deaminase